MMVKGTASPDDPALQEYGAQRTKAKTAGLPRTKQRIARNQDHLCPVCGEDLPNGEDIQVHHVDPKGGDAVHNLHLVHLYCHQPITAQQPKGAPLP